jgi:hypothetical protein
MGKTASLANIGSIADSSLGFRNRIINGAMVIDQRNAGASVTPADQAYTLDRWVYVADQASKCTIEQTISGVSAPAGFSDYLGVTSTATTTITTSQVFAVVQRIEGYNMADFAWGTASAATVTLSFWVRSSLTGTFGGALRNNDGNYNYPFSYTISSANTWEQKSVTITGATSGTWLTTNGRAMQVVFGLGAGATVSGTAGAWSTSNFWSATGATQVLATNGATFYITGVQLEKGSTATSFDYRPYGTELALCQRYLPAMSFAGGSNPYFGAGMASSTTTAYFTISFPVIPRVPPTGLIVSSASHFGAFLPSTATTNCTSFNFGGANSHSAFVVLAGMAGLTAGNSTLIYMNNSSALLYFTGSEL